MIYLVIIAIILTFILVGIWQDVQSAAKKPELEDTSGSNKAKYRIVKYLSPLSGRFIYRPERRVRQTDKWHDHYEIFDNLEETRAYIDHQIKREERRKLAKSTPDVIIEYPENQ